MSNMIKAEMSFPIKMAINKSNQHQQAYIYENKKKIDGGLVSYKGKPFFQKVHGNHTPKIFLFM